VTASQTVRAPLWFWIVGVVLVLWGLAGTMAFYTDAAMTPEQAAKLSAYDQKLLASRPFWFLWVYGVATFAGLAGAVALMLRSALARPLTIVSLVAVVVMFGFMFAATDLLAVKGATAAIFPVVIALIELFQLWLAGRARRAGWIG